MESAEQPKGNSSGPVPIQGAFEVLDLFVYQSEEELIQELMTEDQLTRAGALEAIEQIRNWSKPRSA
jgi:hypothetical protein